MTPPSVLATEKIGPALRAAHPELERIAAAARGDRLYLVGGAVRDLLLGRPGDDVDLVTVGDAAELAARLGEPLRNHARFATAKVRVGDLEVDIAAARRETYPSPGALPLVSPAPGIEEDLARRDFTINAMAIPLGVEPELIDPHGGRADLEAAVLRVLHERSFVDDPTRALRAARYAARLGLTLAEETEPLLRATDLGTISEQRRDNELRRLAAEPDPAPGFVLLAEWGLIQPREGGPALATAVAALLDEPPWRGEADRVAAVLAAVLGPVEAAAELAGAEPASPADGYELARGSDPVDLALARALGAEWLDEYLRRWRDTSLAITGTDLLAAGVPPGPAVRRGLTAALRLCLDGEAGDRESQLRAALTAARADEVA